MKFEARHLRFTYPLPWPGRPRLLFLPRGATIWLRETALVIEGYRLKLTLPLPVVGRLLYPVLAEWTTLTIPYSRIECHRHQRGRMARLLGWLLVALPWAAGGYALWRWGPNPGIVVATGMASLTTLLLCWKLMRTHHLIVYRPPDGIPCRLAFRFRSREHGDRFRSQLEQNRELARQPSSEAEATQ
jgi:hypothetical protein